MFRTYKIRFKKLNYKVYEKVEVNDLIKLYPRIDEEINFFVSKI
jgi:hypothetical protein